MKYLKISLLQLLLISSVFADSITYYGISTIPAVDVIQNTKLCSLDAAKNVLSSINNDLKNQSPDSIQFVKNKYAVQFKLISDSMLCQYQAKKLGITQLPAVVYNNQYVVYGQASVSTAVQEIKAYLGEQHVG